jgi:DDE superfamily endonuclease
MYRDVAVWQYVRGRILEKRAAKRQVSRETGISRRTINKILLHESPPSYPARPRLYPTLGPYTRTIDKIIDQSSPSNASNYTIQEIVGHLRREHNFTGSYDSVRNYIRQRMRNDDSIWDKVYDLITRLQKKRAIELIRMMCQDDRSILRSRRLRPYQIEASIRRQSSLRLVHRRLAHFDWMRRVMQNDVGDHELHHELHGLPDLDVLLNRLRDGRLTERNRAMVVLASQHRIPNRTVCDFLGVSKAFVRSVRRKFDAGHSEALFARKAGSRGKVDDHNLKQAVFELLHEPPANHGINRTSWTMPLLSQALKGKHFQICPRLVSKIIKAAGYKLRKAKVVLTSNDPDYTEKVSRIRSIVSNLRPDEAFFSIDEYGPFAIKAKPGRLLVPPGTRPTVPQWQKSRGCMIVTAALELSRNQVTHFYSTKKNTNEMIRMMEILVDRYAQCYKLYLSWDAASWHISRELFDRIACHNAAVILGGGPLVETAPLPARAQFLNVIESVFSGMARAIIHNSDYKSVAEAKAAIDRYFAERNEQFQQHPRRAGQRIWGKERAPAVFTAANNCKDPRYR